MRCSASESEWCIADPGPPQTGTVPGLQRTAARCAAPGTREREGPTCGCRKMARRRAPCFRPVLYRELCNCSAWCGYGNRNPACALMLRDAAQRGRAGARLRELACCATPQHEGKRGRRVLAERRTNPWL